ncbi:MAG: hypothetical protein CMJ18_20875 [Phycisphaeraceae bacterium]|nr:hypothetical protein [Phycisphaeraceae bacterium]
MFDSGALPAAERLVQFTARRHRVLADGIANLSTPFYKPRDLDPKAFQSALADAIDRRRKTVSPIRGPLEMQNTRQLRFEPDRIDVRPDPVHRNILFHDQNNRDLERLMQHLAENTVSHQVGIELVKNQFDMIGRAIEERA